MDQERKDKKISRIGCYAAVGTIKGKVVLNTRKGRIKRLARSCSSLHPFFPGSKQKIPFILTSFLS